MELTRDQAAQYVEQVYLNTNPAKPHEAVTISNILGLDRPLHGWRFRNHLFCTGCGHELRVLDQFLAGFEHHSVEFFREYLRTGEPYGTILFKGDGLPTIQTLPHSLEFTCLKCGTRWENPDPSRCHAYCYQRPKPDEMVISMSPYWADRIGRKIGMIGDDTPPP